MGREGAADGPVSSAAAPVASQHTSSALQLASIVVQGFDSTVYELSTPFSPDRQQYASIVPEAADSVMLCLLPSNGEEPWLGALGGHLAGSAVTWSEPGDQGGPMAAGCEESSGMAADLTAA